MTNRLVKLGSLGLMVWLALASSAVAQTAASDSATSPETRPATNTFLGDTGLWFVPTGDVLPAGKASGGFYYINQDFTEGFTDVADFAGVFAYGLGDRAEIFGAVQAYRRIDADRRPVLLNGAPVGYPFLPQDGWGTGFGDVYLGAKVNIAAQHRQQPLSFGVRGIVKLPTASDSDGLGSGKPDFLVDAIASKEFENQVEISGYGGVAVRSDPDNLDLPAGFRYGIGFAAPTRGALRVVGEAFGELYFDDTITASGASAVRPANAPVKSPFDVFVGVDWMHRSGLFIGSGFRANLNFDARGGFSGASDETGDNMGIQFRLGYHPGVKVYVPPPPPPKPPAPPVNRPPTVKARCEPCVVEVGKSATVTGDAQDPDGDPLTYKWSAPTGTFANPADRQSLWTAPNQEGSVPVTITVDDGRSGTATDTVTIQVVRPPVKEFKFEDVHFDFDRYSLRAEATRVLDEAVRAMTENPELRIQIEGHTCSIGTAEYNLALGERRATSVQEYLLSRGIAASRLSTVSYGEERPKHDNAREETRRLNRRAALVVRLQ